MIVLKANGVRLGIPIFPSTVNYKLDANLPKVDGKGNPVHFWKVSKAGDREMYVMHPDNLSAFLKECEEEGVKAVEIKKTG